MHFAFRLDALELMTGPSSREFCYVYISRFSPCCRVPLLIEILFKFAELPRYPAKRTECLRFEGDPHYSLRRKGIADQQLTQPKRQACIWSSKFEVRTQRTGTVSWLESRKIQTADEIQHCSSLRGILQNYSWPQTRDWREFL